MKIKQCPEGHQCDSDCQNTRDCPCNEHRHTFLSEMGRSGGLKHNALKSRDTILAKYGSDFYVKLAAKRKKGV